MSPFDSRVPVYEDNVKAEPRMLSPGYYSQECNAHKPCETSKFIVTIPNSMLSRILVIIVKAKEVEKTSYFLLVVM